MPLKEVDALDAPLRFRDKPDLSDLMNQPIRLQMKFRGARSTRCAVSFIGSMRLDVALLKDGKPIDRELFDYSQFDGFGTRIPGSTGGGTLLACPRSRGEKPASGTARF